MFRYSIIIIVKNTKEYLKKCLDSAINQTFQDYEIIVVDDNSEEKCIDIIQKYQDSSISIKYYYLEESVGPGGSRNYGMNIATGKYILFIDSDDWIDIDCLQVATPVLEKYDADIGMYSLVRNYDFPVSQQLYKCKYSDIHVLNGTTAFKIMSGQYDFGIVVSPSPVNKIYKKEYLIKNHISFLKNVYYEDVFWGFQTLLRDGKVVTIPCVKYHHYKRIGSIVQSISYKHFDDIEKIFLIIRDYLMEQNIYSEYIFEYYKIFERFYNLLVRQIFEYSKNEDERKQWLIYSFNILKKVVNLNEYIQFVSAEEIRRHLQPYITDTTLF